jgi:hypothetical protein
MPDKTRKYIFINVRFVTICFLPMLAHLVFFYFSKYAQICSITLKLDSCLYRLLISAERVKIFCSAIENSQMINIDRLNNTSTSKHYGLQRMVTLSWQTISSLLCVFITFYDIGYV